MKKHVLRVLKVLLGTVVAVALIFGGYVLYLQLNYYRISDNAAVTNEGASPATTHIEVGKEYTASTYNIGFGAYTPDYTFFMDEGIMADGTRTKGEHGRAVSKDSVEKCTEGALETVASLNSGAAPDFMLFQEVDRNSDRSYHVNQVQETESKFSQDASYFAQNFHTGFLAYPIPEFHGSVDAGLMTLSNVTAAESTRRSYPVDQSFFAKFFDLDRCFMITRYPTSDGHELVLINSHMSAYDAGGTMRAKQLAMLREVLTQERAKGNYVITGGDWNHALAGSLSLYPSDQQVPDWVAELKDSDLPEGFSVVKADNLADVPSCRGDDIPYTKGHTYTTTVDGWIVSDNVKARAENIDTGFAYSDHNPVLLRFTLGTNAQ
ncbi:endonuclease [Lancefieldella rimae]|uniref:endonuclease n=1 Tax=Lancefieldella rimae TaxID=1383 RepID=UPI003A913983